MLSNNVLALKLSQPGLSGGLLGRVRLSEYDPSAAQMLLPGLASSGVLIWVALG